MKKRTIIISHIDVNNNTAFVKNMGINEISLFNRLKDNGIELNDENLSDNEICMLLNYLCTDGVIEGIFSIKNNFNRDQAEINIIKHNIEERLKSKGFSIISHCSWTPSFSDYDTAYTAINTRNYLTLLTENISEKEKYLKIIDNKINENKLKVNDQNKILNNINIKVAEQNEILNNINIKVAEQNEILNNINNSIIDKLYSILKDINDNNDNYLKEAKQKFMRTVKMYIINNRDIPEFEKTTANNIGLDINTINSIINVLKNKV